MDKSLSWPQVARFAVHTLMLTTIFIIIAAAALGLSLLVRLTEAIEAPVPVTYALMLMEYSLLAFDMAAFLYYLGQSIRRFLEG